VGKQDDRDSRLAAERLHSFMVKKAPFMVQEDNVSVALKSEGGLRSDFDSDRAEFQIKCPREVPHSAGLT